MVTSGPSCLGPHLRNGHMEPWLHPQEGSTLPNFFNISHYKYSTTVFLIRTKHFCHIFRSFLTSEEHVRKTRMGMCGTGEGGCFRRSPDSHKQAELLYESQKSLNIPKCFLRAGIREAQVGPMRPLGTQLGKSSIVTSAAFWPAQTPGGGPHRRANIGE